jgi:hypothetical protein
MLPPIGGLEIALASHYRTALPSANDLASLSY